MSGPPAIVVSELSKSYRPDRPPAVRGISFRVEPGEILGLLGPNGAGKTTTVKMILGLILPTSGSVRLAGYDPARRRRDALSRAGALLEGARNVYWRLSARANLEYFGALKGLRGGRLAARIDEVLCLVGLADRADEEVRRLSRGMQQKVALAVAVLHDPDVLLLDEPTLGLDVQAARTIEGAIRRLAGEEGKAILLTTHQMALSQRVCDRIFVIDGGRQVVQGAVSDVLHTFGDHARTVELRVGCAMEDAALGHIREAFPFLTTIAGEDATILLWPDGATQRDLVALVTFVDAAGLPILYAGQRQATLEEIFVRLTAQESRPA
jgi:ABC-2 type transport system ATP-binding protein